MNHMEAQSTKEHKEHVKKDISFGIITVSSSRSGGGGADASGDNIAHSVSVGGYRVVRRDVVGDDAAMIKDKVLEFVDAVDVIVCTGGTGIAKSDVTVEAVRPLFDKEIEGFNTLFMMASYDEVGSACVLSRACAGVVRGKVVFCLPGSPDACRLAMDKIVVKEAGHIVRHAGE